MNKAAYVGTAKKLLRDPGLFVRAASRTRLRNYQREVFDAVINSVLLRKGLTFVVMFPRQSGKNELQAQIETYLLSVFSQLSVDLIKVSPTLQPQALNAMRRLERTVNKNILVSGLLQKEAGSLYRLCRSSITFLSAAPESNIVGATASTLLEVDEAQDVLVDKFDREIAPMATSKNATRVFWGTAWTSQTLLGRELRAARAAEAADGIRRVFTRSAEDVCAEVPSYARHVQEIVARQGRDHPLVRTQYFSEEIDSEGGMFPSERIARMMPENAIYSVPPAAPVEGKHYALLLDVAGEDEGVRGMDGKLSLANPARDATALTLVEVSSQREGLSTSVDKVIHSPVENASSLPQPVYKPVRRWQWLGANHTHLLQEIRRIALDWRVQAVAVDATGVGAGLASFLENALPGRVIPFQFNTASKSKLGWDFLAVIDSHRWQEPRYSPELRAAEVDYQVEFLRQLKSCIFSVSPGPEQRIRWGVPDGTRDPQSGEVLHDDWILSAALCALLEQRDWTIAAPALIVQAADPLREMEGKF